MEERTCQNGSSTQVKCMVDKCAHHVGDCGCSLDSICVGCDATGCTNCKSYRNK